MSYAHIILIFSFSFLAQLLAARNELRAIQERAASGPSTACVQIEYPANYKNLQATMGLAGDRAKYNRWLVSFLFFFLAKCTVTDPCIL